MSEFRQKWQTRCFLKKHRISYFLACAFIFHLCRGNEVKVPKTGSTTLTNAVMYDLCRRNGFHVLHLNLTRNRYSMNLIDQRRFIENITSWHEMQPAIYHGHAAFIDFTLFGVPNPIYINLLREPLERLLSHYYFLRYGDNYRIGLKRSRAGNNETFDECVARRGKDCDMKQMWLQIPYFCGTHHFCSEVGNVRALEQAKRNLLDHYLIVGLNERMRDFIALLEILLPKFFNGALEHFDSLDERRAHLRNTKKKIPPNERTLEVIKSDKVYIMEREFYDFAVMQFENIWKRTHEDDSENDFLPQQFHFEKIKP
uniref:Heparan sulfate 2-O-sulfotransferase n=1 Tax=Ascaris lumbricoides TaxID=6252 RepID=A0A0M3HX01_ASCLU